MATIQSISFVSVASVQNSLQTLLLSLNGTFSMRGRLGLILRPVVFLAARLTHCHTSSLVHGQESCRRTGFSKHTRTHILQFCPCTVQLLKARRSAVSGASFGEVALWRRRSSRSSERSPPWIHPLGCVYLISSQLWGVGLATAYKTQSA